jgi:hypothetical protein
VDTPALDFFKLAAVAFGAVRRPTLPVKGVTENGMFMGGVKGPITRQIGAPAAPAGVPPPSAGTNLKMGSILKLAGPMLLKPTEKLLRPTSMGARGLRTGDANLKITPSKNIQPEHAADVPGGVGIAGPTKAASALAYFAMLG